MFREVVITLELPGSVLSSPRRESQIAEHDSKPRRGVQRGEMGCSLKAAEKHQLESRAPPMRSPHNSNHFKREFESSSTALLNASMNLSDVTIVAAKHSVPIGG